MLTLWEAASGRERPEQKPPPLPPSAQGTLSGTGGPGGQLPLSHISHSMSQPLFISLSLTLDSLSFFFFFEISGDRHRAEYVGVKKGLRHAITIPHLSILTAR